jgi:hypothetical protein
MKTWIGVGSGAIVGILGLTLLARFGLDGAKVLLEALADIHITNVQSPVRVVGGSIHMVDKNGWTRTYTPPAETCNDPVHFPVNHCHYTSESINTTRLYFENVIAPDGSQHDVNHPLNIPVTGRWKIDVYASQDDGTKDSNGVALCTSSNGGSCDSGNRSSFVTIQPLGSYGFYPEPSGDSTDRKYHNGNLANCPYGRCEDINTITLTMNGGAPVDYACIRPLECVVRVGQ